MTEERVGRKIASLLSAEVSPSVENRLALARSRAVMQIQSQGSTLVMGAHWLDPKMWVVLLLILCIGFFYLQAMEITPAHEDSVLEEDVGILSEELPLEFYHDKGFSEFLKKEGA